MQALETERVIVPIRVEVEPRYSDTHVDRNEDHGGEVAHDASDMNMTQIQTSVGPAFGVWTSVEKLHAFDPHARPMPVPTWRMALAALADVEGRLVVNPASRDNDDTGIIIPKPATAALAQRDTWLPAWRDADLKERLIQVAGPPIAGVKIVAGEGITTVVHLLIPTRGGERPSAQVLEAVNRITRDRRLLTACDRIVITPVPVRVT